MSSGPLRITQVVATDVFAGTERYVANVANALAQRGHDVAVVGGETAAMRRALDPGVRWQPGSSARAAAEALVRGGRRDVVHSHMTKADFVAVFAAPVTRGARISTRHITVPRGYSPAAQRLAPVVRRLLSTEIAVSRWTSDQLERPADVVLVNGVPPAADVDTPRDDVVLVAQRLAPEKDTATAVRAWARSGLAARGWRLVIAGAGEEQPAVTALAAELGVAASVDLLGWVDDPTALYRTSAVLLAPAPTEPCGLVLIEAMAHGLPVVAAGSGGNLETVGQEPSAALFPPGDADAAAALLVGLADDPAARRRYGVALQHLQRTSLTISAHVDRLETIYRAATR